ncbi:hypothetical protein B0H16DRAFT_1470179 [Mycena metata]|uniref:Uncharacterized protein n=1 Tax=Mycena metata TaxID=1033252 RepID=A0AAD7MRV3_9AGAR|nr:hypothetical protein B0H16DRAFT_1470179 [Mycena metata]
MTGAVRWETDIKGPPSSGRCFNLNLAKNTDFTNAPHGEIRMLSTLHKYAKYSLFEGFSRVRINSSSLKQPTSRNQAPFLLSKPHSTATFGLPEGVPTRTILAKSSQVVRRSGPATAVVLILPNSEVHTNQSFPRSIYNRDNIETAESHDPRGMHGTRWVSSLIIVARFVQGMRQNFIKESEADPASANVRPRERSARRLVGIWVKGETVVKWCGKAGKPRRLSRAPPRSHDVCFLPPRRRHAARAGNLAWSRFGQHPASGCSRVEYPGPNHSETPSRRTRSLAHRDSESSPPYGVLAWIRNSRRGLVAIGYLASPFYMGLSEALKRLGGQEP